jgi:hypothetical protein
MGNELRANVYTQIGQCWIQLEDLLDRVNHPKSSATSTYTDRQTDAAVLIDHVQELERAAIHRLIEFG